jgi:hypothetical protein
MLVAKIQAGEDGGKITESLNHIQFREHRDYHLQEENRDSKECCQSTVGFEGLFVTKSPWLMPILSTFWDSNVSL